MAAHPVPPFSNDQVDWLRSEFMPLARAHDCCPKCSGLRCLVRNPCPEPDCPLREAVLLEEAA